MREFFKRNMLWVGLVAVLAPLGVLLSLQYRWLVNLQQTSAIAQKAQLDGYLGAVGKEIEHFYYKQAWNAFQLPEYVFTHEDGLDKALFYLDKKGVKGARYLFLARYTDDRYYGRVLVYDPNARGTVESVELPADRAIMVALSPWKALAYTRAPLQSLEMVVDERDPNNRIILQPVSEEGDGLIGVVGMVLDNRYFEHEILPFAIKQALGEFMEQGEAEDLAVTVRDNRDRLAFGMGVGKDAHAGVSARIPFVFRDWRIGLATRFDTPEQLARSNFLLNISMSVLLAVVLLGGIVIALRTASREVKLSQMKSDFVSNVSHELRTPLASIRVFGEFLRLGRVGNEKKVAEYGEYIETESRRLTQLINNILDFSKIESGAKTYQFCPTDVQAVVEQTLRTLEVSLRHRGFNLTYSGPQTVMPEVEADPDALAQALANLVDNAVKYSNGETEIRVSLEREGRWAVIAVRDNGIGISREEQRKIFDRFHRVSTGLVHDVKGSGLGLSIVSHIVQAHGGRVTVESELGKGSEFRIRLPLRAEGAEQVDVMAATAGHPGPMRNS